MHLVRLLRMASEILRDGIVRVTRPDREELLAIRDGALSYDELLERCEALEASLVPARSRSPLPENPDEAALDALAIRLIQETLFGTP